MSSHQPSSAPEQASPGVGDNPPDLVLIGQFSVANPGPNGGVIGEMFVNARHTTAAGVVEEIALGSYLWPVSRMWIAFPVMSRRGSCRSEDLAGFSWP